MTFVCVSNNSLMVFCLLLIILNEQWIAGAGSLLVHRKLENPSLLMNNGLGKRSLDMLNVSFENLKSHFIN